MDLAGIPLSAGSIASCIALSVANIDDPSAELGAIAGSVKGELRLCYQTVAGADEWTVYAWDDASSTAASTPYRINGTSGQWQAVAGKYANSARNFNGIVTVANATAASDSTHAALVVTGGIASGQSVISTTGFAIQRAAGTTRDVAYYSGTSQRWALRCNSTAEGGASAGSDFTLLAVADDGTTTSTVLAVTRASGGSATWSRPVSFNNTASFNAASAISTSGTYTSTVTNGGINMTAGSSRINMGVNLDTSKLDSQGVAWSAKADASIVFNGLSTDRAEISWIRGARTSPEFSLREHVTSDNGGQLWAGPGTASPTLSLSILSTGIKAEPATASSSTSTGSIVSAGGMACALALNAGGVIKTTDTTEASAVGTASIVGTGGLGIAKRSFLGTIASSFAGNVIAGVQDATASVAGQVGEVLSSVVAAVAITGSASAGNVTSLSVTAGKWLIYAFGVIAGGATGLTSGSTAQLSIVTGTATNGTAGATMAQESILALLANDLVSLSVLPIPVQITGTQTYFLTEQVTFAAGSPTCSATLAAVRIR